MDRDKIKRLVDPLFERQACVSREEILARIDGSPHIDEQEKDVLKSLWKDDCYTRDKFCNALDAYGQTSPISYGGNLGGF